MFVKKAEECCKRTKARGGEESLTATMLLRRRRQIKDVCEMPNCLLPGVPMIFCTDSELDDVKKQGIVSIDRVQTYPTSNPYVWPDGRSNYRMTHRICNIHAGISEAKYQLEMIQRRFEHTINVDAKMEEVVALERVIKNMCTNHMLKDVSQPHRCEQCFKKKSIHEFSTMHMLDNITRSVFGVYKESEYSLNATLNPCNDCWLHLNPFTVFNRNRYYEACLRNTLFTSMDEYQMFVADAEKAYEEQLEICAICHKKIEWKVPNTSESRRIARVAELTLHDRTLNSECKEANIRMGNSPYFDRTVKKWTHSRCSREYPWRDVSILSETVNMKWQSLSLEERKVVFLDDIKAYLNISL